jgi:hypothetical protein
MGLKNVTAIPDGLFDSLVNCGELCMNECTNVATLPPTLFDKMGKRALGKVDLEDTGGVTAELLQHLKENNDDPRVVLSGAQREKLGI